jgi:2-methylisocitrate lyase-like PEP mutase family enzyme
MSHAVGRAAHFRQLHAPGQLLLLPNCWDAASARVIEACGATAMATTSAGLAWSRGYPDGDLLPVPLLAQAVAEIARVVSVPLTVDVEGGYSADARVVGETITAVVDAGAVGINIEDGKAAPELLCAKIEAAKTAATRAGVDLFVNARTDVFLRGLVPPEQAVAVTIERARQYRSAGCDGVFVPGAAEPGAIRELAAGIALPLNVMVLPALPSPTQLRELGVRRVSAGAAIAQAAYGLARRAATRFLDDGRYDAMFETPITYGEMNALLAADN